MHAAVHPPVQDIMVSKYFQTNLIVFCKCFHKQARSRGGATHHPQICQKVHFLPPSRLKMFFMRGLGPLFVTKWAQNGVLRGGLGPKGPLSGVPHPPPKIESGYGPVPKRNILRRKLDQFLIVYLCRANNRLVI